MALDADSKTFVVYMAIRKREKIAMDPGKKVQIKAQIEAQSSAQYGAQT